MMTKYQGAKALNMQSNLIETKEEYKLSTIHNIE